jgi:hypothetical protein
MQMQSCGDGTPAPLYVIRRCLVATVAVIVFMLPPAVHAEEQHPVSPSGFGNTSSRQNDPLVIAAGQDKQDSSSVPNKAAALIDHTQAPKKGISAKKFVFLACVVLFVVFVMSNLIASTHNDRICSRCGYIGSMKVLSVSGNPFVNSILKLLIAVFPVLLYYYSERGRFICPVCNRTNANMYITQLSLLRIQS